MKAKFNVSNLIAGMMKLVEAEKARIEKDGERYKRECVEWSVKFVKFASTTLVERAKSATVEGMRAQYDRGLNAEKFLKGAPEFPNHPRGHAILKTLEKRLKFLREVEDQELVLSPEEADLYLNAPKD